MPILSYFAVVGAALVALLFVADASLEQHGPMAISSNFEGLPKPWKPELNPPLPLAKPQEIRTAAVPALDPKWNESKPVEVAAAPAPQPAAPVEKVAKAEPAPKKQKRAAARRAAPRREIYAQRYAWRHDGNGELFGGTGNAWRF